MSRDARQRRAHKRARARQPERPAADPPDFEPKARGVCQTCGTTVETAYGMGSWATGGASISNVRVTMTCTNCGDEILMADLQTMHRDGVTVVGTSRMTAESLFGLAEQLRSGVFTPEQAADRIEELAPSLSPLSDWLRANGAYAGWLSVVLTLILHFVPSPGDDGPPPAPSPTEVEETLRQILEELRTPDQTTPALPGTSTPPASPPPAPTTTPAPPTAEPDSRSPGAPLS